MELLKKIRQNITTLKHGRFFSLFTIVFTLVYHCVCLVLFSYSDVKPMFYINIFSVTLYIILLFATIRVRSFVIPFIFFYAEVLFHQIAATYYVGGETAFHYLILLSGIVPLLTFMERIGLACFFGFVSMIIFALFEIHSNQIIPEYPLSSETVYAIRFTNIIIVSLINIIALLLNSLILWFKEYSLEATVQQQDILASYQNKKIVSLQNNIIESLANLLENRDVDTGAHIQRTKAYVELISKEALSRGLYPNEITNDFVKRITRAAPLHDIGKILVSDIVLKKASRLTPDEFELMKTHTKEGKRIVMNIIGDNDDKEFIQIASDIVTYHHEHWDGSGYPVGLKENNIPVAARIMAIADVFDALVSARCYKKAFPVDIALKIIQQESGTQFDPQLTEAFLDIQDKIMKVLFHFSNEPSIKN